MEYYISKRGSCKYARPDTWNSFCTPKKRMYSWGGKKLWNWLGKVVFSTEIKKKKKSKLDFPILRETLFAISQV